jgi:hypothetical protein
MSSTPHQPHFPNLLLLLLPAQKDRLSPMGTRASVSSYDDEEYTRVDEYEHPSHVHLAATEAVTAADRERLRKEVRSEGAGCGGGGEWMGQGGCSTHSQLEVRGEGAG